MSRVENFHSERRDMANEHIDPERKLILAQEQKEVRNEMIYQEYKEGINPYGIAGNYGLHPTTVYKIIKRKKEKE